MVQERSNGLAISIPEASRKSSIFVRNLLIADNVIDTGIRIYRTPGSNGIHDNA